jgi:putative selenium metabolism hydrolase
MSAHNPLAIKILEAAHEERDYITRVLQDLIRIPSLSCEEEEAADYVRGEMEKLGLDEVFTDSIGSVVGKYGSGEKVLLYDSHMDTVGVGDRSAWKVDPFEARLEGGVVYGRGASDNKAGLASMIGGLKVLSKLKERGDFSLYVVGIVEEEVCEGLALSVLLEEHGIAPECVVLSECTDLGIYRGHRGRAEVEIITRGRSCHGSAPERGDNALYKMAPVLEGIKYMNENLNEDAFLGRGSIAATKVECETPSVNAIPDMCRAFVDRRTVPQDTAESVAREIDEAVRAVRGEVSLLTFSRPSYTGYVKVREKFFPGWALDEKAQAVESAKSAYRLLFEKQARTGRWLFSTDGNYSMGIRSIPTIGFGPGEEHYAHTVDDQVRVEDMWKAAAFYALFPFVYSGELR